jgi:alkylation response protein AidB-like acyl-CoA dehydrogenase
VKAQRGISFLLIDLNQPGVKVRPIRGLAGDLEINEVFLDEVTAPLHDLVGEEGQGWTIAKFLLEHERGGSCFAPRLLADIVRLRELARHEPGGEGRTLATDSSFAASCGRLELEAQALEITELRILAELARGAPPGPQSSLVKLIASTLRQRVDALAMRVFGYAALELEDERPLYGDERSRDPRAAELLVATPRYLNSQAWTIFGGSNEIQRTIIARTVLHL